MPRLLSRQKQIPNGFSFYQPETGWRPQRFASFDTIVNGLIAHRKGNPFLTQQKGWATDVPTVENEVDFYNALVCKQMNWDAYITDDGGAPPPKMSPPARLLSRAGQLAAGIKTQLNWLTSGADAVPKELSEARAQHCLKCPKHGKGDWTSYFTVPAQQAIQDALNVRREWQLETSVDNQLQICEACYCPMKLKVHMPIGSITAELPADSRNELDPNCWILAEEKK